jgi:hypothetical protein
MIKRASVLFLLILLSCTKENKDTFIRPTLKVEEVISSSVHKTKGLLFCDSTNINIGNVKKGVIIKRVYKFKNVGLEKIEILGYEKSCSCTSLETRKTSLDPNESTEVIMLVETKDKELGEHEISATIKTNGKRTFYMLKADYTLIE